MTIPDPGWFEVEQSILDNARRLVADALLLVEHGRHATAFAVAVIALEEVGKIVLRRWRTMDTPLTVRRRSLHLSKQCAVASLLVAARLRPQLHDGDRSRAALGRLVAASAATFLVSAEGDWQLSAEAGLVDRKKQAALYQDEGSVDAMRWNGFMAADALLLVGHCRAALDAVDDFPVMELARSVFEMGAKRRPTMARGSR